MAAKQLADCFIIMPTTTPESLLPQYGNEKNHFAHVLDHLFCPAIKQAGLNPVRPIQEDGGLIHPRVMEHLDTAELVLCDMSCLDSSVFFELGIRTALNKPVCLVRDSVSDTAPFDSDIVNYHSYNSDLAAWELENQVELLTDHITGTSTDQYNSLWHYFGIATRANSLSDRADDENTRNDRLEYLAIQVDAIRAQLSRPYHVEKSRPPKVDASWLYCAYEMEGDIDAQIRFHEEVSALPHVKVVGPTRWSIGTNQITVFCNGSLPKSKIPAQAKLHGLTVRRLPDATAHSWRES